MRIGCVSLVFMCNKIVAIDCFKGRGIILPGGKLEPGETIKQCAARELLEETDMVAVHQELIFQAPTCVDDFYCFAFLTLAKGDLKSSDEGEVILADWKDLMESKFTSYYELLFDAYTTGRFYAKGRCLMDSDLHRATSVAARS